MIDLNYSIAGALTGFVVGLTGVGGGALMTPILLLVFGVAPATAVGTDLWFAAITKIAAAGAHHKSNFIEWSVVKRLWLGSIPVAIGAVIFVFFGAEFFEMKILTKFLGILVMVTAIGLLASSFLSGYFATISPQNESLMKFQYPLTIFSGAFLGLCVALTSVGAGALGSIMLLCLYPVKLSAHKIVATDIVHAIPIAVISGAGYLIMGKVNFEILSNLLLGSIPATIAGSFLAGRLSSVWLKVSLGVILFIVGLKTMFN